MKRKASPPAMPATSVYDNSGKVPIRVPGYGGRPVSEELDKKDRFATGHRIDASHERITVRELSMMKLIELLTEKPEWYRKVKDPEIVAHWRAEAMEQLPQMTDKAFDWAMRELVEKAEIWEKHKFINTLEGEYRVLKSDDLITQDFADELKRLTQSLIDKHEPFHQPGNYSNAIPYDVIHPSFYPLVYGRTRVLPEGVVKLDGSFTGEPELIPLPEIIGPTYSADRRGKVFSNRFQWLPCEVAFKGDSGTDVEIISYINNLPPTPENKDLYRAIEKAISLSIEPWNQVLVKATQGRLNRRIDVEKIESNPQPHDGPDPTWPKSLEDNDFDRDHDPTDPKYIHALEEVRAYWNDRPNNPLVEPYINWESGLTKDSTFDEVVKEVGLDEAAYLKHQLSREIVIPDVGDSFSYETWRKGPEFKYRAHEPYEVHLESEFRQRGLQVIVKLTSHEFSYVRPWHGGGRWHLEGLLNEHIVATSILYFDSENITMPHVFFRHEAYLSPSAGQDDFHPHNVVYGTEDLTHDQCLQDLGYVSTPQGRLLAFPNTLQHCVSRFSSVDRDKPAHRRMLVLWLVDPNYRIISTRNVPPQQASWAADPAMAHVGERLPPELVKEVGQNVNWTMSDNEAKAFRSELTDERSRAAEEFLKETPSYNFCEH